VGLRRFGLRFKNRRELLTYTNPAYDQVNRLDHRQILCGQWQLAKGQRFEARAGKPDGPRLSWYKPNSVSAFARWRSFVSLGFLSARHRDAGCDYYPRVSSRFPGKTSGQPFPLLCLAPHGVFHAIPLTQRSGGLLPRPFTLTQHHQLPAVGVSCQLNQLKFAAKRRLRALEASDLLFISNEPTTDTNDWQLMVLGGLFSVILSVT
jgi:hypothetical protein